MKTWIHVFAGAPQGSVLGPLLFLIDINDIVDVVESEITFFAEVTTVFVIVDNPERAAEMLNNGVQNMTNWANQWLVTLSLSKTKSMTLSYKNVNHPALYIGDTAITEVDHFKHLAVTFQSDLSWSKYVKI